LVTHKDDATGNTFEFKARDDKTNVIDGNSNEGQDYSSEMLSDEARYAMIEYLRRSDF